MRRIELSTASKPLSQYANELDDEIVILISEDKPVAAIVPLKNVDKESLSLSTQEMFLELINQAREEVRAGKTVSLEEMKRSVLP
jgi:antitoxin (DNA-binding transcriptional repressor) of toxin-antitoxin stability system